MLTAIFPIDISSNPFWSSPQGLSCVNDFLKMTGRVEEIDRSMVVTQDREILRIAEKNSLEILSDFVPEHGNEPCSFDWFVSLGMRFNKICPSPSDAILMVDHRNLLLTTDDISQACKTYAKIPRAAVISLTLCRDYPCQYKSYSIFLGAGTFHLDTPDPKGKKSESGPARLSRCMTCTNRDYGEITLAVASEGSGCRMSFSSRELIPENVVLRIIPFDPDGPDYKLSRVLLMHSPFDETLVDIDLKTHTGIIALLTAPSRNGEYDTVEIFTPPNAPWDLSPSESVVRNSKTREPMYSRQQFPSTYVFDGSFCILGRDHLIGAAAPVPMPVILRNSCIVSDWVDYWYTVTASMDQRQDVDMKPCFCFPQHQAMPCS